MTDRIRTYPFACVLHFCHDSSITQGEDSQMAGWPKTVYIKGIGISVGSWEEMDEVVSRYGTEGPVVIQGQAGAGDPGRPQARGNLTAADQSVLQTFVDAGTRGVLTSQIGPAIGKRGKGIRPALDLWSRKIGLVDAEDVSAFESVKGTEGRGFRLTGVYLEAGKRMLGRK
jgi:hypothetical protein